MRALIVKTSSLGDIVHTFPTISYLKSKKITIDWVVEHCNAELCTAHPDIDKVLCIDSKKWRASPLRHRKEIWQFIARLTSTHYDVIFDLQGNSKSGLITYLAKAPHKVGFQRASVAEWPNLLATNRKIETFSEKNIREELLFLVKSYFNDQAPFDDPGVLLHICSEQRGAIETITAHPLVKHRAKILVCPGSIWKNKRLPTPTLLELLKQIQHAFDCSFLFSWGSEQERTLAEELAKSIAYSIELPKLSLPALQHLMHQVDLVVAMDSLPLHLAGSVKTPTWGLFGPSSALKYNPIGPSHLFFQGKCPYSRTFTKRCAILRSCPTGACLREQQPKQLFTLFEKWAVDLSIFNCRKKRYS